MSILTVTNLSHSFGDRAITNHLDVDAKAELKRALIDYRGIILIICHEPEFYEGLVTNVWDCSKWTTLR